MGDLAQIIGLLLFVLLSVILQERGRKARQQRMQQMRQPPPGPSGSPQAPAEPERPRPLTRDDIIRQLQEEVGLFREPDPVPEPEEEPVMEVPPPLPVPEPPRPRTHTRASAVLARSISRTADRVHPLVHQLRQPNVLRTAVLLRQVLGPPRCDDPWDR